MGAYLLGIDMGTSSVRAGVFREDGTRVALSSRGYPILSPYPEYSEQAPGEWWLATCEAVKDAISFSRIGRGDLAAISFDGQMHGGVMRDGDGNPVCNAVIWPDSRSAGELNELTDILGEQTIATTIMNRIFPGTFAATLFWMSKHDQRRWKRIRHILTAKDYIRFRITGLYNSEPSDASATLLFDQDRREWSEYILKRLDISVEWMPFIINSDEPVGETFGIEEETGLPDGIPVVMGGADQACAAFGNGILDEGIVLVTIGTGGQVCTPLVAPRCSPGLSLNTFCHLPESRWYLMGATLSAGLSLRWYRDVFCPGVPFERLDWEASSIKPGDCPLFLPYLPGKRSPDLNPDACGIFSGIRLHHNRGHFVRSIMEGVVYDLKESFEVMKSMGIPMKTAIASGGGARSRLWMQIMADILNEPIQVSGQTEQACFGAALVAGIGVGIYKDYRDAARLVPVPVETVEPRADYTDRYTVLFERFKKVYREMKEPTS